LTRTILLALAALCASPAPAFAASAAPPEGPTLTDAQRTAAFTAAGFHHDKAGWHACGDPGDAGSYTPGSIDEVTDLNGDGRPEAVISEGSGYCFGNTGTGYSLVSQQADGSWKLIGAQAGVPEFLETRGKDGWPDLEVGGPGFCFPVLRWNGAEYAQNRFEYEGKACRP
jgi:hypothetical protein